MGIPKLWGRKPGGVERGFVYSHVLTTYYNWKNKVLLKDKLDDMDRLIAEHGEAIAEKLITNEKFAEILANYVTKAMMTGQDVDNENMIPNSAFIHSLAQQITSNQTAIEALSSETIKTSNYPLYYRRLLNENDNLNTFNTLNHIGYYFNFSYSVTLNNNYPVQESGLLEVLPMSLSSNICILQRFTGSQSGKIGVRCYRDGKWWNDGNWNIHTP